MENEVVVVGLLQKRAQIDQEITALERMIRVKRGERDNIDGAICLFAPSVVATTPEHTKLQAIRSLPHW